jgi:hypothetical protein
MQIAKLITVATIQFMVPARKLKDESIVSDEREALDVPLSPIAAARLEAGLASARRGEVAPWRDFSAYAVEDDE